MNRLETKKKEADKPVSSFRSQDAVEIYDTFIGVVGEEKTDELYEIFRGQTIYFPRTFDMAHRDTEIYRLKKKGLGAGEIARNFGISQNHVHRIIRDIKRGIRKLLP